MGSLLSKKDNQEKKSSKEDQFVQLHNDFQIAFTKIGGFYKKLHSINCELKEITEHKIVITNPDERQRSITGDFKLFKEQISWA